MNKISIDKIKLIIWDLDETLWKGTISEGEVAIVGEFAELIRNTTDAGIVHSICSKNDFDVVKNKLQEYDLWEYFVFPSINWQAKGSRIKDIIIDMNLRAENVLFIDDNIQNLKEASFFNDKIMVCLPQEAGILLNHPFIKNDTNHKRLEQYRVLEEKKESSKSYSNNTEFLMSCNIRVCIHNDCVEHIERLHDLVIRSNQLNYTKNRCTQEELLFLINDSDVNSGYVTVTDKFGDYGIVGFYCIKKNKAIHYLFSCRTLGMLVEQYVYMQLNCPEIDVVGDVVTPLNKKELPAWINQRDIGQSKHFGGAKAGIKKRILLKGPCDISQIFSFIKESENIKQEFTYVNDMGLSIEGHNHSAQIASALTMKESERKRIISQCVWLDEKAFDTELKNSYLDYVVLSMVTDASLGLYRHKETNKYVAFYTKKYNVTVEEEFRRFEKEILAPSKLTYSYENYKEFEQAFEFVPNADYLVTMQSLNIILEHISKNDTKLVLLLGSEIEYPGEVTPSYQGRETDHRKLNSLIRTWADNKENVILIPFDKYITDEKCFLDTINHFKKIVYFNVAKDLVKTMDDGDAMEICGKRVLFKTMLIEKVKILLRYLKKGLRKQRW